MVEVGFEPGQSTRHLEYPLSQQEQLLFCPQLSMTVWHVANLELFFAYGWLYSLCIIFYSYSELCVLKTKKPAPNKSPQVFVKAATTRSVPLFFPPPLKLSFRPSRCCLLCKEDKVTVLSTLLSDESRHPFPKPQLLALESEKWHFSDSFATRFLDTD